MKAAIEALPLDKLDELGNRIPAQTPSAGLTKKSVAGAYSVHVEGGWSGLWTLKDTGEATCLGLSGTFAIKDKTVTITWANGTKEGFTLTSDTEGTGLSKDGAPLTVKKSAPAASK